MTVDLNHLRVGDTIVFADGTSGICTVSYNNGGARFVRWNVPGKDWSGSDRCCCFTGISADGRLGNTSSAGTYIQTPKDIVDIIKPPIHELQDEIDRLRNLLKSTETDKLVEIRTILNEQYVGERIKIDNAIAFIDKIIQPLELQVGL